MWMWWCGQMESTAPLAPPKNHRSPCWKGPRCHTGRSVKESPQEWRIDSPHIFVLKAFVCFIVECQKFCAELLHSRCVQSMELLYWIPTHVEKKMQNHDNEECFLPSISCELWSLPKSQRQSTRARYVVENYRLANTSSNLSKETETA